MSIVDTVLRYINGEIFNLGDDVEWAQPQTRWASFDATAFRVATDSEWTRTSTGGLSTTWTAAQTRQAWIQIVLPHGARIDQIVLFSRANTNCTIELKLRRYVFASAGVSSAAAVTNTAADDVLRRDAIGIASPTEGFDYSIRSYGFEVEFVSTATISAGDMDLIGVALQYTVGKLHNDPLFW